MFKMPRKNTQCIDYLAPIVVIINVFLLITAIVTFITIREDIAHNWKFQPEKPFISDIPFDYIFALGIGCISTGLLHTFLWYIAECIDSICLMKLSIGIGVLKEIVSIYYKINFVV